MIHIGGFFHGSEGQPSGMTAADHIAANFRNRRIVDAIQAKNDVAAAWKARAEAFEADNERLRSNYNTLHDQYTQLGAYAKSKGIVR